MYFLAVDATQWILPAVLLVLVVGIFVLNYFRSKKNKENMQNMVDNLKVGDNVKTYSGLYGKILEIVYKEKQEMGFDYRKSILQDGNYILLGAEFELKKAQKDEIDELLDRNLRFRKEIQPSLANPNAGSVFKNPENDSAGRLLDKAGVKEFSSEKVQVWAKHANFIINKDNATSEDILGLMSKMYLAVKEKYRIELTPEIIFIGDKSKKEEELCKILYQKKLK